MRRVRVAFGVSLVVMAAALAFTLTASPIEVIAANTHEEAGLGVARAPLASCQSDESLPADTHAVRLQILALLGPMVTVQVFQAGRLITDGQRSSGWTGGVVTVPVKPLRSSREGVELCYTLALNGHESAVLTGEPRPGAISAVAGEAKVPGRVKVEYLRPGPTSWWSLAPAVVRHIGIGGITGGTWSVFLAMALTGAVVCVASYGALRASR